MRTEKLTASEKLWAENCDQKGSGIGSMILLAIMAVALVLVS